MLSKSSFLLCSTIKAADSEVRVDAGEPGRARQAGVEDVGDVLAGARVSVLLRNAEVDQVQLVRHLLEADQEVLGLDVSVDVVVLVQELHPLDLE